MSETTEETLARHERQIAALKAALKECLSELSDRAMEGHEEHICLTTAYREIERLLDSDE